MIITRISNGLGNQLFQYAIGRRLSHQKGESLKFDISWFDHPTRHGGVHREYKLHHFDIAGTVATDSEVQDVVSPLPIRIPVFLFGRAVESGYLSPKTAANMFNYYFEVNSTPDTTPPSWPHSRFFSPEMLEIEGDAYLHGYWQSPRYFESITKVIRKELTVAHKLDGQNREVANLIDGTNAVGIHIRRGLKKYGTELPIDYYRNAIKQMDKIVDNPTYFIFSDTPKWSKEYIRFSTAGEIIHITHNDGSTDYEDLRLLRMCDHHIIANSTFSWWGAWLGDSPEQVVLAPASWMGRAVGKVDQWDYIPDEWSLVDF